MHLRLGSQSENIAEARSEGALGKRLTADQAREIVKLAGEGDERHEIADRFGVSGVTIRSVLQGRSWSEATGLKYRGPLKPGRPCKPDNEQQPDKKGRDDEQAVAMPNDRKQPAPHGAIANSHAHSQEKTDDH